MITIHESLMLKQIERHTKQIEINTLRELIRDFEKDLERFNNTKEFYGQRNYITTDFIENLNQTCTNCEQIIRKLKIKILLLEDAFNNYTI